MKSSVFILVWFVIGSSALVTSGSTVPDPQHKIMQTGEIFVIEGEENLETLASDGTGTEDDPYILEFNVVDDTNEDLLTIAGTTSHILIQNSVFNGGGHGISLMGVSNVRIENSQIFGNKLGGVYVQDSFNSSLRDNDIYDNSEYGIRLESSGNIDVIENEIHDNVGDDIVTLSQLPGIPGIGILIDAVNDLLVEGNKIFNNAKNGIEAAFSNGLEVIKNTITFNEIGVYFSNVDRSSITENIIENHDEFGIFIEDCHDILIEFNEMKDNFLGDLIVDNPSETTRASSLATDPTTILTEGPFDLPFHMGIISLSLFMLTLAQIRRRL